MFKFNDGTVVVLPGSLADWDLAGELQSDLGIEIGEAFSQQQALSGLELIVGQSSARKTFNRLLKMNLIIRA